MKQPPKDKKERKEQQIIGETAPDKTVAEKEVENNGQPSQEKEPIDDKEELTNMDQKITNTDEKNDPSNIAN